MGRWHGNMSWDQPGKNLKHADDAVKAWTLLSPHEHKAATMMTAEELQAAANKAEDSAATAIDATLNAEEEVAWINLIQDISRCKFGDVIRDICQKLGIKNSQVAAVKCSLPCESLSPADASNMSRDFHHRDHTCPNQQSLHAVWNHAKHSRL